MAERIYDALQLAADQRQRRMRRMRDVVRRNDIYWWLERFLRDMVPPRYRKHAAAGPHQARMDWSPVAPNPRMES
jgi:trehalose-6-phosphate synthase